MDVNLYCEPCGQSFTLESEDLQMPQVELIMNDWAAAHKHSEAELRMYHEATTAQRNYAHSHPYGGEDDA